MKRAKRKKHKIKGMRTKNNGDVKEKVNIELAIFSILIMRCVGKLYHEQTI